MKKYVIGMAFATILVVVASAAYVALLDVNQYKGEFIDLVEASTGRAFSIQGDIGLKLSLIPTLSVESATLGNAGWASHETMMTIERIEARLALLPLLRGELALKRLAVVGGRISLETNRKGQRNWVLDFAEEGEEAGSSSVLPRIDLDEVEVRQTVIEYRARGEAISEIAIDHLSLHSEGFGQPLALAANARFRGMPINLSGRISALRRLLANEPYIIELAGRVAEIEFSLTGDVREPLHGGGVELAAVVRAPQLASLAAPFGLELSQRGPVEFKSVLSATKKAYFLNDIEFQVARSKLAGAFTIERSGPRWRVRGDVDAAHVDPADFLQLKAAGATRDRLFSATPLSLGWLDAVEGQVGVAVANIAADGIPIADLRGQLRIDNGVVELSPVTAKIGDGALSAALEIDVSDATPKSKLDFRITRMALGSLPKLAQGGRVAGGPMDLTVLLEGRGKSVAATMAGANGVIAINTGAATINNDAAGIAGSDLVMSLFSLLNPLSATDTTTKLECAAIRFPIVSGRAHNETGVGVQTRTLSILGGGTVDLSTETLDIGARPKPREGLGINLSSLVDFVRLGGTLTSPSVSTDAAGVTTAGLKVGAAVATAGLSVLAEGLFDRATANADVCAIASGKNALKPRQQHQAAEDRSVLETTATKTKSVIENAGATVKGVFKGLFGD